MKSIQRYSYKKNNVVYLAKGVLFLLVVIALSVPSTVAVSEAAFSYTKSCAGYEWRHKDESLIQKDEECKPFGGYVKKEVVFDNAVGEAWGEADISYGVHMARVVVDATSDVNMAEGYAYTEYNDILKFGVVNQLFGNTGTAEICWSVGGAIEKVSDDGEVYIAFGTYWNNKEVVDHSKIFDSNTNYSEFICGQYDYEVNKDIEVYEYFSASAYVPAVSRKFEEWKGHAEGNFMTTVKLVTINLPKGHYLAYSESGTNYPINQPGPTPGTTPVNVPTMTEWGMIIFMFIAGIGAIYYLRKRRRVEK